MAHSPSWSPSAPLALPGEVAAFLRKSEKTLANWRSHGIGPRYVKVGHSVLYDWRDVRAWVEVRKRP